MRPSPSKRASASRAPANHDLEVRETTWKGSGVYARRDFAIGDVVLEFQGPRLALAEIIDFSRVIQIGEDLFLGSSGGVDDYVNHSCDPNSGAREQNGTIALVALRPIACNDEITFDYSTCMLDEPWVLECQCRSEICRGSILRFTALSARVRTHYLRLEVVPEFVAKLIRRPARTAAARRGRSGGQSSK